MTADLLEAFVADTPADRSLKGRQETSRRVAQMGRLTGRPLLEVTTADIEAWLERTPKSRKYYACSAFDFYDWAVKKGLIGTNPALPFRKILGNWEPPTGLERPAPGVVPTLGEAVDLYIWDRYGRRELTLKSARSLADRLKLLVDALGADLPADRLDRRAVLSWQHTVSAHAPASRRAYLSTVRTFCGWAIGEGYLTQDPTAGIARIKQPRLVPRALPQDAVTKLLEACETDSRDLAIVWLQVGLGLRCAEVAALEMADWDPISRKLFVRGKGGHERVLPATDAVCTALERYLDDVGRCAGPLIRARAGTSFGRDKHLAPQAIVWRVGRLMKKAGIKRAPRDGVSAHALRHTCASDALDKCGNVRTVQEILGHASLSSTQIYLRRANLDQMREALEGRSYQQAPT
jgi:integrase/recombinase XerD